jgi:hypothetical protein
MRKALSLIILLLILLALPSVKAVNLKLAIRDDVNSDPLMGVTATVNETGAIYIINKEGTIYNLTPGTYHIILRKFGYWTKVIPVTILPPENYPSENLTMVTRMNRITQGPYYVDYQLITPDPDNLTIMDSLYLRFIMKPYSGIGEGTDNVNLYIHIDPFSDGQNLEVNDIEINGTEYPSSNPIISIGDRPNGFDLLLQLTTISNGTDRVVIYVVGENPTSSVVIFDKNITVHNAPIPNITSTEENGTVIPYNPNANPEHELWGRLLVIAIMFIIINALYYGSKKKGY